VNNPSNPNQLATWLRARWVYMALNAAGAGLMVYVWSAGSPGMDTSGPFHPGLESGKWAMRWLLISLTMTPLNSYLGWREAVRLRKPAGLWSFAFASAHFLSYLQDNPLEQWLKPDMPGYLVLGVVGLLILAALAATSTDEAKRVLAKGWKRLHRWVYLAGAAIGLHAILALDASKILSLRDPEAGPELNLYLGLFGLLMLVRLPAVKAALTGRARGRKPVEGARELKVARG
jgi:DMSO/TMAO reductase YedYZ heme-binding membrane subunit